jgi:hypothetical protein
MGISEESTSKLLTDTEDLTTSLINLALSGAAVPHLHNGDMLFDVKGNLLVGVVEFGYCFTPTDTEAY